MEDRNCPICGKPVGDYLKDNIRCGKCGSNLEVYRILHEVDDDLSAKGLKWKPAAIISMLAAVLFAILYIFSPKTVNSADSELLVQLEDSIAVLNKKLSNADANAVATAAPAKEEVKADEKKDEKAEEVKADEKKDEKAEEKKAEEKKEPKADPGKIFEKDGKKYYTVEKGDSWWKVCAKLYGPDKVNHADIAKLNGRSVNDGLHVGETIQVK